MKCVMCENKKPLKKQHVTKKYTDSGLDNVTLHGVEYYKCNVCGEEYYGFGDQEQLHRLISQILIQKDGRLTGKECRFLRTFLGFSTQMFSRVSHYEVETISRMENGKSDVSDKYDVLIRLMVANKIPDRNYDLHDWLLRKNLKKITRIEFTSKKGEWKLAA